MRILFATSIKTWGGGEEWMLQAATGLADRGHDTTLAARPRSAIRERARTARLDTLPVPFRSDADAASFLRVYGHCRRTHPDVLCLNMDRVLRVGGTAARLAGVPVVLPRRGSEFALKDNSLYRFLYQKVATGMIVNSRATEATLARNLDWRPAGRTYILPNGVDVARFEETRKRSEVRRELDLARDAVAIAVVGELTARKNARLLIEVLPDLVAEFPGIAVLLIGEGAEAPSLREQADQRGVLDRVRFLGFRSDVPDLLGACDLLVHPSRVEGFGYAVAEAMAAGLPVVATNASSLPEIVVDGETGLLFPPEDAEDLARAVRTYLADPARRARDGAAGRARVKNEFSSARRLDDLERIFREELALARETP